MKEQLISFKTAVLAKEKGFDVPSIYPNEKMYGYKGDDYELIIKGTLNAYSWVKHTCLAPTQSLLQKWLREKYYLDILITKDWYNGEFLGYEYIVEDFDGNVYQGKTFKNYEEALEVGLYESLKKLSISVLQNRNIIALEQLNNLLKPDVSGRSEQLVCPSCGSQVIVSDERHNIKMCGVCKEQWAN